MQISSNYSMNGVPYENRRRQIFFATFVKNVETHIKTNAVKKALNRLIHQQVYHL